jgi:hypothetical protein
LVTSWKTISGPSCDSSASTGRITGGRNSSEIELSHRRVEYFSDDVAKAGAPLNPFLKHVIRGTVDPGAVLQKLCRSLDADLGHITLLLKMSFYAGPRVEGFSE